MPLPVRRIVMRPRRDRRAARLVMATISSAEISTTMKATAEPAPKSYIEKLSFQIWKESSVVAVPGPPPVIA